MLKQRVSAFEHLVVDVNDLKRFGYKSVYAGLSGKNIYQNARIRGSRKRFLY